MTISPDQILLRNGLPARQQMSPALSTQNGNRPIKSHRGMGVPPVSKCH